MVNLDRKDSGPESGVGQGAGGAWAKHTASGRAQLFRNALRVRLFYKILVANALIVVAAGVLGAVATAAVLNHDPGASTTDLTLLIATVAMGFSMAINGAIVWIALRPLSGLEQTAERVSSGDLGARAPNDPLADRDLRRLIGTFNTMLDGLSRYREALRGLARRALDASETERRRLARELHDDTAQQLAGTLLHVRAARTAADAETRDQALVRARDELATAVDRVRRFALALRPPAIDLLGLTAAIQAYARETTDATGLGVVVEAEPVDGLLGESGDLALYRIVQDALSNVVRHAAAASATVELYRGETGLRAVVRDNGRGFRVDEMLQAPDGSLGLLGMQERAATVGGQVRIRSTPGGGTRVEVEIPFEEAATHV